MATETAEMPVYLYETLAPLGEVFQDESPVSPSSFGYPVTGTGLQTTSRTVTEATTLATTTLHSSILSSAVTAEDRETEELQERLGATSASSIDELEHGLGSNGQDLGVDAESFFSERNVESVQGETTGALLTISSKEDDFDFLSLDMDDSKDANLAERAQLAEDKVIMSAGRNSAAQEAPPWARTGRSSGTWFRSPFLQLHQEIVDFCNFVSPTDEEKQLRATAVQRVSEVVKSIWPSCQVKVFGSFATGLFLPTSDCDVVILESGCQKPQDGLKAIAKALNRQSLVKNLQVIGKARVPIVKFVEIESKISFDISFDVANGPDAADFIMDAMAAVPPLKPLCLVLKIFLQQRELNEVYSGGIGSYALLIMLLTHLQVDFFDFYGRALNVREVGISCRSGGRFYAKASRGFLDCGRPYLLSVEDPQSPDNDIGKNSYNVTKVRSAFLLAHRLLTKLEVEDVPTHVGLLGRIVRMDKELISRKTVLPKLPNRLISTIKLPGKGFPGGNLSSVTFDSEPETYKTGTRSGSRWLDYEDHNFPMGREPEPETKPSHKRKHARERDSIFEGDDNFPNSRYHHQLEQSGSLTGKGKRSRHRKDSMGPASANPLLSNPSSHDEQHELEMPGPGGTRARNGKISKQKKLQTLDRSAHEDVNTGKTSDGKKHRLRKQNHVQTEDSHEEGEIILKDDFAAIGVNNGQLREEVGFGAGNGYNKHKRWYDGRTSNPARVRSDHRSLNPDMEDEGASRSTTKVVVTKLAHKKITYL